MKQNKNSKVFGKIIIAVVILLIAGIYYYIKLPALNIHSPGLWKFMLFMVFVGTLIHFGLKIKKDYDDFGKSALQINKEVVLKSSSKWGIVVFGVLLIIYIVGSLLSSPILNAKRYQKLMTVENRNFTEDIEEVDYTMIPLLDKASAQILGDRKLGSMVEMVSQFEVDTEYTQINYQGKPVRVTPLRYASLIKWFTNQDEGIPAYLLIDMTTQDIEVVMLEEGIRYSKSEHFNRNLYRHLRFNYPTYIFDEQIFFEIDEEGTPFWVCPVKKYNIGLFGGQTIGKVVLCNAITGDCISYDIDDVPQWVDKVYSAELLMQLYDYHGTLVNGFFNSILGQKGCIQTTNGYNYIAMEDDVWVYTGVTSVNGDQSNVGFVLMNQRTMETRFYTVEGVIEDSAMSSAEGQVQNLGYDATFPLLVNINSEPTYIVALKDDAGLVKKYAMVNVNKYQIVAVGDTIKECERNYLELLRTNGIQAENTQTENAQIKGTIESIAAVVIDNNTHYYLCLEGIEEIYDINMTDETLIGIIRYQAGDSITIYYKGGESLLKEVTAFE